jgi:BirA family biotin operon repressor/biotin-[acetyl-CoA-carboxylase] ligase
MVQNMCPNIDHLLSLDSETLHEHYREHLATIGREVKLSLPDGESLIGRAIDVEVDGRLVVVDECAITHRFDTVDVIHLR